MPDHQIFATGSTFRQYEIKEFLRAENIYQIYVAENASNHETCLIWVISNEWVDTEIYDRINAKFAELIALHHPNLLPILDFGIENGMLFWTTPSIQGRLLSNAFAERTEKQAASIAYQISSALEYLHFNRQVHGSLSPENVILSDSNDVLLINYGLFPLFNLLIQKRSDNRFVGFGLNNPNYLAPEQLILSNTPGTEDIYALGVLYDVLLVGSDFSVEISPTETALRHSLKPILIPNHNKRKVSKDSVRLIYRLTSVQPNDRCQSTSEVKKMFKRLSSGRSAWVHLSRKQTRGLPGRYRNHFGVYSCITILLCLIGSFAWQIRNYDLQTMLSPKQPELVDTTLPEPTGTPWLTSSNASPSSTAAAPLLSEVDVTQTATPMPDSDQDQFPVILNTPMPQTLFESDSQNSGELREIARLGYGRFFHAAWSPDGSQFAVASSAGVFIVADEKIAKFLNTDLWATSVQYSLDGDMLAVGLQSGDIQLWRVSNWQLESTLSGHTNRVSRILFSPNHQQLISASYDLNIIIWDLASGEIVKKIPAHPQPIRDIAISKDGRILASCADDQVIRVWDLGNYSKIGSYVHTSRVFAVAISDDGTFLAAGGNNGYINQWNLLTGNVREDPIPVKNIIWNLYYKDNDTLWVGLEGGTVKEVNAHSSYYQKASESYEQKNVTNELINEFGGQYEFPYYTAISPQGEKATISWLGVLYSSESVFSSMEYESFTSLSISPNDQYLLAGGVRGTVSFIDLKTNYVIVYQDAKIPTGSPFSDNSQYFALIVNKTVQTPSGGKTTIEELSIHNTVGGAEVYRLTPFIHDASVYYALDDTLLLATTMTQSKGWDLKSTYEVLLSTGRCSGCQAIRSSNDGQELMVHLPVGRMQELDQATTQVCNLASRMGNGPAAISPSKQFIVYLNSSGWLELLFVSDLKIQWRIPLDHKPTFILFSPDESYVLTGDPSGNIAAFSMKDGTQLWKKTAHIGSIGGLAISADGRFIITASNDGTIRVWETNQ